MAHILIIEDEEAMALSISFVLEDNGHTSANAQDSLSAHKALSANEFDCVICDVWLGSDDGLDFLSKLRSAGIKTPFIIVSGGGPGRSLENVSTRADMLGAVGMLFKPFGDDELMRLVNIAIA